MSALDKISVQCPQCGKGLSVPATAAGKSARCPVCQLVFRLPEMVAATAVAPAPQMAPMYPPMQPPPQPMMQPQPGPYPTGPYPAGPYQNPYAGDVPQDYQLQPLPDQQPPVDSGLPAINPYAPSSAAARSNPGKYNHGFGMEHRGWDAGMVGGLIMMLIGAVWFFGGLAAGYIFFYAPILFIIGLIGFLRGLFTGNVAGRR